MIKKLALKYKRTPVEIEHILEAPFKMASEIMANGNKETHAFFNIRIPSVGIFMARDVILQKLYNEKSMKVNTSDKELAIIKTKVLKKERRKK
jgi:hypothetical protein